MGVNVDKAGGDHLPLDIYDSPGGFGDGRRMTIASPCPLGRLDTRDCPNRLRCVRFTVRDHKSGSAHSGIARLIESHSSKKNDDFPAMRNPPDYLSIPFVSQRGHVRGVAMRHFRHRTRFDRVTTPISGCRNVRLKSSGPSDPSNVLSLWSDSRQRKRYFDRRDPRSSSSAQRSSW